MPHHSLECGAVGERAHNVLVDDQCRELEHSDERVYHVVIL